MQTAGTNGAFVIEGELWKAELKEELFPALISSFPHMRWLTDAFPTGNTLTIPTTGRMTVRTYEENDEITVEDPTLNEIQLTIDSYFQSGIGLTDKFKQDSYMVEMALAKWRADMIRGLKEKIEADVWNIIHTDATNGHTAADDNDIDGIDHRWAASGTTGAFDWNDFINAGYVLDKENVSKSGRIAVDRKSVV